jgi:hypothetical protein
MSRKILPNGTKKDKSGKVVAWEYEPHHLDGASLFGREWCMIHKEV